MRGRLARIPRPLLLVLAVVMLFNVAWSLATPALQAPDEISHWTYVQTIGELGKLPGDPADPVYSTELNQASVRTNFQTTNFLPIADPEWSASQEREWHRVQAGFNRKDTGGQSSAWTYPPLYYAYEAVAYEAASSTEFFTRLGVLRLASSLWLLLNALAAWLLAGELFNRRAPQVIAAATVGLWPMMSFLSASVNPDAALCALWTCALWLGVRALRRGLTPASGLVLGATVAAAMLTKAQTIALLPTILLLLPWLVWQAPRDARRRAMLGAVAAVAAIVIPAVAWRFLSPGSEAYSEVGGLAGGTASTGFKIREFASYLWQFYLPRLDFMTPIVHHIPVISERPLLNTWIGTSWGVFGWVNVWFPRWVYLVFAAITAAVAVLCLAAAARWVVRRRGEWRTDLPPFAFVALTALTTLLAVHFTDYQFFIDKSRGLFAQGRYLFPVGAAFAVAVAWAISALPRRARGPVAALWLAGLVVLQLASLGLIVGRWYA